MTKKILVIEDNIFLRDTIMEILDIEGYEVLGAGNGKEGLDLIAKHSFDLIITDILMPEKDGIEVILSVRKKMSTNIIAISGGGRLTTKAYLQIAMNLGCTDTLAKPFENDELIRKVKALI